MEYNVQFDNDLLNSAVSTAMYANPNLRKCFSEVQVKNAVYETLHKLDYNVRLGRVHDITMAVNPQNTVEFSVNIRTPLNNNTPNDPNEQFFGIISDEI